MKTAVVISSCDLYKDCWAPMLKSFQLYWPDCPFPIYFVSNYSEIAVDDVTFIKVGEHKGFCSNLKKALAQIEADRVILFLEDYFLAKRVDSGIVTDHVKHCIDHDVDFLKVDSHEVMFRDGYRIEDSDYCHNVLDIKYSLNACIAIWNKFSLMSICSDGFSAWDFERKGIAFINDNQIKLRSQTIYSESLDSQAFQKICSAGAVCKGRWTKEGVKFLQDNNYFDRIAGRQVEGRVIRFIISRYRPNSIVWLPLGLMLRLLNKFNMNL